MRDQHAEGNRLRQQHKPSRSIDLSVNLSLRLWQSFLSFGRSLCRRTTSKLEARSSCRGQSVTPSVRGSGPAAETRSPPSQQREDSTAGSWSRCKRDFTAPFRIGLRAGAQEDGPGAPRLSERASDRSIQSLRRPTSILAAKSDHPQAVPATHTPRPRPTTDHHTHYGTLIKCPH